MRDLGLVVMLLAVLSPAEPLKGRAVQTLDGRWLFREQAVQGASVAGWVREPAPDARATQVPSLWNCATAPSYHGTGWYWRTFETPSAWKDQNVRLFIHGVVGKGMCYLNGTLLGSVSSPYRPAQFDITKLIKWQEPNVLAIRVEAAAAGLGGIWKDVELVASDEAHITGVLIVAEASGWVTARVDLENTSQKTGDAEVYLEVSELGQKKLVAETIQHVEVSPGRNRAELLLHVKKPHLWSPNAPFLYSARVSFRQGRDILDDVDTVFGFREVRAEGGRILINGAPMNIRWATVTPLADGAPQTPCSDEYGTKEIEALRAKGFGGIWVAQGLLSDAALVAADKEGMLIAEGSEAGISARDLVAVHGAHPSVAVWRASGIQEEDAFRAVDNSRPVLAVPPAENP
ncbi:MAG: sugar-binding domain-containing protein [Chthonomonadales bacterium]